MRVLHPNRYQRRVYCAGPLFNAAERREMLDIAEALRAEGFEPFVPHADGMEFADVHAHLAARGFHRDKAGQLLHEAVFALDVYQVVVGCGSLVFNMNGRVPDEGAVAEAAMAWTLGKPVVIYKEDVRSKIAGRDNPLLVGPTGFRTVARLDQVAAALAAELARGAYDPEWETPCPANLATPLDAGEQLWERLAALDAERPPADVAEAVFEVFGRLQTAPTSP